MEHFNGVSITNCLDHVSVFIFFWKWVLRQTAQPKFAFFRVFFAAAGPSKRANNWYNDEKLVKWKNFLIYWCELLFLGHFCVVFPSVCTAVSRPVKFSSLWAPGLEKKLLVSWSPRGIGGNFLKQRPGPCSCILKAHPPPKIHPKSQSRQRPLGNFQPCWGGGSRQTIHITIGKTSHIGATKTHKKKQHCWPLLQQLKKKKLSALWVSLGFSGFLAPSEPGYLGVGKVGHLKRQH